MKQIKTFYYVKFPQLDQVLIIIVKVCFIKTDTLYIGYHLYNVYPFFIKQMLCALIFFGLTTFYIFVQNFLQFFRCKFGKF